MILGAIGAAIWFWVRNNPRDALHLAQDAATTLRNAPRRIAFRRQTNEHPVEGIDDPRIAICAIAQAFVELDDLPTQDQRQKLHVSVRTKLRCDEEEAEEMEVLGRWLMTQCQGAAAAIPRLGKRMFKIDGEASWTLLQEMLGGLIEGELSSKQVGAIEDLRVAFKKRA
jgi:hypothetical protein